MFDALRTHETFTRDVEARPPPVAHRRGGQGHRIPEEVRKELVAAHWKENGGLCTDCGKTVRKKDLSVDHVVSIRLGGKNSRNNARVICLPCNSSKGDRQGALDEFVGCGGSRPRRRKRA